MHIIPKFIEEINQLRNHKSIDVFVEILRGYDHIPKGSTIFKGPCRYGHQRGGQGQIGQSSVNYSIQQHNMNYISRTIGTLNLTLKGISADEGDRPDSDRHEYQNDEKYLK